MWLSNWYDYISLKFKYGTKYHEKYFKEIKNL